MIEGQAPVLVACPAPMALIKSGQAMALLPPPPVPTLYGNVILTSTRRSRVCRWFQNLPIFARNMWFSATRRSNSTHMHAQGVK